jgi:uncharacterized protein YneF (UPF0154 family)
MDLGIAIVLFLAIGFAFGFIVAKNKYKKY